MSYFRLFVYKLNLKLKFWVNDGKVLARFINSVFSSHFFWLSIPMLKVTYSIIEIFPVNIFTC